MDFGGITMNTDMILIGTWMLSFLISLIFQIVLADSDDLDIYGGVILILSLFLASGITLLIGGFVL